MAKMFNCALMIIPALLLIVVVNAQDKYTTPVPILKQINLHNDDGSYSYGYEAADRSFKIETKFANGEVHGKYGYVDDSGNLREIEYGASRRGFEPKGTDINVAPPTLTNSVNSNYDDNDDGQYREDPSIYYKDSRYNTASRISTPSKQTAPINFNNNNFNQNYQKPSYNNNNYNNNYNQQQQQQEYRQNYQPEYQQNNYQPTVYNKQNYQSNYQPQYQQNNYQTPQRNNYQLDTNIFNGHPATNFDLNTGSYSLNYSG